MTALLLVLLTQAPARLEEGAAFDYAYRRPRFGVVELAFTVPADARMLQVRFGQRLEGMRVEVWGEGEAGRSKPLQPERRYAGDQLELEWTAAGVRQLRLVLHHHLRAAPTVAQWSIGRQQARPRGGVRSAALRGGTR